MHTHTPLFIGALLTLPIADLAGKGIIRVVLGGLCGCNIILSRLTSLVKGVGIVACKRPEAYVTLVQAVCPQTLSSPECSCPFVFGFGDGRAVDAAEPRSSRERYSGDGALQRWVCWSSTARHRVVGGGRAALAARWRMRRKGGRRRAGRLCHRVHAAFGSCKSKGRRRRSSVLRVVGCVSCLLLCGRSVQAEAGRWLAYKSWPKFVVFAGRETFLNPPPVSSKLKSIYVNIPQISKRRVGTNWMACHNVFSHEPTPLMTLFSHTTPHDNPYPNPPSSGRPWGWP